MNQPPAEDDRGNGEESLTWAESFTIPDDISALEPDIARWREEERLERSGTRRERLVRQRIRTNGFTVPMIVVSLLLLGALGAATILFGPRPDRPTSQPQPLAASSVDPGKVGGLLPAAQVTRADGSTIDLSSLRPAILTLVPADCACDKTIAHVGAAAVPYGIRQYVVTPDRATLTALPQTDTATDGLIDGGSLRDLFGSETGKPTIVVVGADGVVRGIEIDAGTDTTLNGYLDAVTASSHATR